MEPGWVNNSQRQLGQKYQTLELQDWKVRLDAERSLGAVRFKKKIFNLTDLFFDLFFF